MCCAASWCQSDDSQVLVFRKSGEVNLFYNTELDSMVISKMDADSVEHDDYVSQVFFTSDTVMVVPLEEIDSVAFGSRNVIEFRDDVVVIDEQHRSYIISYNVQTVTYNASTPTDILPSVGQILFYNVIDDKFPSGLAARVTNVASTSEGIVATLEKVELEDVFSRLFYAGTGNDEDAQQMLTRAVPPPTPEITHKVLDHSLEIGEFGTVNLSGPLDITHRFVVNTKGKYYHAEINVDATPTFDMAIHAVESSFNYESEPIFHIQLPPFGIVLWPSINIPLFVDYGGEINGNLTVTRNYKFEWWWTRKDGVDTSDFNTLKGDNTKDETSSNTASLTVDGELYMGVSTNIDIGIIGQYGVVGKLKIGPCLSSNFGLGVVQDLATNPNENNRLSAWGAASLSACLRLAIEADTYNPEHIIWGKRDEKQIFALDLDFLKTKISFLPYFQSPRAVTYPKVMQSTQKQDVSVAVKDNATLVAPVDVGFEIEDEAGEVLDSVFVEPTPQTEEASTRAYTAEISVDALIGQKVKMVPIVHYAGYTLRHVSTAANRLGTIQPIVSSGSNGLATFVSGSPIIGQATKDSTVYLSGNYLPVNYIDTMYVDKRTVTTSYYISGIDELIGTWTEDGFTLTFTDTENGTCTDNGETKAFEWVIDDPQTGDITLYFKDGESSSVYSVMSFSNNILKLKDKRRSNVYVLSKS